MAKPLIAVDSEARARSIQEQFLDEFDVLHLVSPPLKVSHIPSEEKRAKDRPAFAFAPAPSESRVVSELMRNINRKIYLALESDQRGEYWSWMISEFLLAASKGSKAPLRIHLIGLTKEELQESFKYVEPVLNDQAISYYVRNVLNAGLVRHVKRLLGTVTGPGNLPLDYATLTILSLLVDREMQIRDRAQQPKWQVKVVVACAAGEFSTRLTWARGGAEDGLFENAADSRQIVSLFKEHPLRVASIQRKSMSVPSPTPYRLTELLQDAAISLGMAPVECFEAIQTLFAGIDIQGSLTGLISSYNCPERGLVTPIIQRARNFLATTHGEEVLGPGYQMEDEGEAYIFPTRPKITEQDLADTLGQTVAALYGLIRSKALASQMVEACGENIEIEFSAGPDCLFQARGKSVSEKGHLAVFQDVRDQEFSRPCLLAELVEGQELSIVQVMPEPKTDHLPEYYTFETLAADLADFSIMMDSFTVAIMQTMIDTGYVSLTPEGGLQCLDNALVVINTVNQAFPKMPVVNLSAYLEQHVTEVVGNRKSLDSAQLRFDQTLFMQGRSLVKISDVPRMAKRTRGSELVIKATQRVQTPASSELPAEQEAAVDPSVQQPGLSTEMVVPVVEAQGQNDSFAVPPDSVVDQAALVQASPSPVEAVASAATADRQVTPADPLSSGLAVSAGEAAAMPEDDHAVFDHSAALAQPTGAGRVLAGEPARRTGSSQPMECPECGKNMAVKEDQFGKFWLCSGFPACRYSVAYEEAEPPEIVCPVCKKGRVLTQQTAAGRTFYVCEDKSCDFMAWAQPFSISCPVCESPYLVEKKTTAGKSVLRCPRAGCRYQQAMPGDEKGDSVADAPVPEGPAKVRRVVRRVAGGGGSGGGKTRKVLVRRKP